MISTQTTGPNMNDAKQALALKRQPDAKATTLHFSGGIRAQTQGDLNWMIEPVVIDETLCAKGPYSQRELEQLSRDYGLNAIAFEDITWKNGAYHSFWMPVIKGRTNSFRGPADLWASIAKNITRHRIQPLKGQSVPTSEQLSELMDDTTDEERLALSISLSLRSMDICVEQITDYYNEHLANRMASSEVIGNRFKTSGDYRLFSSIHSFFLHLGSARDYLGALIAVRLGIAKKNNKSQRQVDSVTELMKVFRNGHTGKDPLSDLLIARGLLQPSIKKGLEWEPSGWFLDAAEQRNEFVHRRPYGLRHDERWASIIQISPKHGLYRYTRPILLSSGNNSQDILDVIVFHYKNCAALFCDLAECSGLDTSIMEIKADDIISVKVVSGDETAIPRK